MKITFAGNEFDASDPISIAIPMEFAGGQPNAFGVDRATSQACESGPLVGDTRRGGSCNFEKVTMIPHCNGTHTECVGHVTSERIAVIDCLRDVFSIAALISIAAEPAGDTGEKYVVPIAADDLLITERALRAALAAISSQLSTISECRINDNQNIAKSGVEKKRQLISKRCRRISRPRQWNSSPSPVSGICSWICRRSTVFTTMANSRITGSSEHRAGKF
ncbi:MAG: cyclase family protein [Acidobacteria bacterium]|nr:cyclase family protein [Acidobacteriota bacterium]